MVDVIGPHVFSIGANTAAQLGRYLSKSSTCPTLHIPSWRTALFTSWYPSWRRSPEPDFHFHIAHAVTLLVGAAFQILPAGIWTACPVWPATLEEVLARQLQRHRVVITNIDIFAHFHVLAEIRAHLIWLDSACHVTYRCFFAGDFLAYGRNLHLKGEMAVSFVPVATTFVAPKAARLVKSEFHLAEFHSLRCRRERGECMNAWLTWQ
jgi:hypothetical protein